MTETVKDGWDTMLSRRGRLIQHTNLQRLWLHNESPAQDKGRQSLSTDGRATQSHSWLTSSQQLMAAREGKCQFSAEMQSRPWQAPMLLQWHCTHAHVLAALSGVHRFEKEHMKWGKKSRGDVGKELVREERVGFYQNILCVYMKFSNNKSNEKNHQ